MSSLYERKEVAWRAASLPVDSARLDRVLGRPSRDRRIALWIDVEGKALEALMGAQAVLDEVLLIHIEVETRPCIAPSQHLYPAIDAFLGTHGFHAIAASASRDAEQLNVVYVRRRLPASMRIGLQLARFACVLRHHAGKCLVRLMPDLAQRLRSSLDGLP